MPETLTSFEVFMIINADGECEVGMSYDDATDRFGETIGGYGAKRVIKLTVRATLPPEIEEASVDVPDHAGSLIEASSEGPTESSYPNG